MDVYTCDLCGVEDTLISTMNGPNGKGCHICRDCHTRQAAITNAARTNVREQLRDGYDGKERRAGGIELAHWVVDRLVNEAMTAPVSGGNSVRID